MGVSFTLDTLMYCLTLSEECLIQADSANCFLCVWEWINQQFLSTTLRKKIDKINVHDFDWRRKHWLWEKEKMLITKKRRETAECFLVKLSLKLEIFSVYFNSIWQCLHAIIVLDTSSYFNELAVLPNFRFILHTHYDFKFTAFFGHIVYHH